MKRAKLLLLSLLVCGAQVLAAADSEKDTTDSETDTESVASEPIGLPKKVKKALAVDSISAVVYAADGKKQSSKDGKLGDKLFNSVQLNAQQSVEVSFIPQLSGSAAKPQQAMLMASSKVHPRLAAYAIAKVKKDGSHVVTLGTTSIEKQLGTVGGEFELSLLLGDPAAHIGLSGALGTIVLPETASGAAPKLKLLTAAHQPISNFKPNIAHTFRAPDKRAPAIVSLTFTGLALAPLGLLVIHLTSLGVNLKGMPAGAATLWVLLFHGGIAAMLLLYLLFWLRLNLAQTLPLALALGLFVAVTGYKALSAISDARIAEAKTSGATLTKKTN